MKVTTFCQIQIPAEFSISEVAPEDELLLWAHYADKHKGIRLRFIFDKRRDPDDCPNPVRYSKSRVQIDFTRVPSEIPDESLRAILHTKGIGWQYEREYRIICGTRRTIRERAGVAEHYFLPFKSHELIGLDFGLRCSESLKREILSTVSIKYPHATVRQAVMDPLEYGLNYTCLITPAEEAGQ